MDIVARGSAKNYTNKVLGKAQKDIDILYKLNKGQTYDFETKSEVGQNEAPSGAEFVSVVEASGNTTQDGEPTPDNPIDVVGVSELRFRVGSRNLWHYSQEMKTAAKNNAILDGNGFHIKYITDADDRLLRISVKELNLNSKKTYRVSYKVKLINGSSSFVQTVVENSQGERYGKVTNTYLNATDKTIAFYLQSVLDGEDVLVYDIMLEEGENVHEYDEFHEELHAIIPPRPLLKIGEYADKLICDDKGEWKWEWNTHTVEVTEDELNPTFGSNYTRVIVKASQPNSQLYNAEKYVLSLNNGWGKEAFAFSDKFNRIVSGDASVNETLISMNLFILNTRGIEFVLDTSYNTLKKCQALCPIGITYVRKKVVTESVSPSDVDYLENISGTPTDKVITITDQNGNDVSWVAEYIIKLGA